MYIYKHMYIHIYEYIHVCISMYMKYMCVYICKFMYTYLFMYFCICICVFMYMCMHTLYTYVYIRILHTYEIMYVYDRNWTFPKNTFVVILIANALNLRIHLRELQFILFYFYHPRKYFAI